MHIIHLQTDENYCFFVWERERGRKDTHKKNDKTNVNGDDDKKKTEKSGSCVTKRGKTVTIN